MKKGINAWCFPGRFPIRKSMELAKQAGFDSIELNISEKNINKGLTEELNFEENMGLTIETTDNELKEIYNLSIEIGIEISSVSTGLHWTYPLTSSNEEVSKKGMYIVEKMIHTAKIFKTNAILVVPGCVDETVSYKAAYEKSIDVLKNLGRIAEKEKVYICIENVWNKFLLSPLEMNRFIDEIGCEYVRVYFDVGNVLQYSYPEYWIEILKDKIKRVHVKDFDKSIGNINGFTDLFQGDVDWKKVKTALDEVGYDGYITAELSPYKSNPEGIAIDTARHLEFIINE